VKVETDYEIEIAAQFWKCPHCKFGNATSDEFSSTLKRSRRFACVQCKAGWTSASATRRYSGTPPSSKRLKYWLEGSEVNGPDASVMATLQKRYVGGKWAMLRSLKSLCRAHLDNLSVEPKEDRQEAIRNVQALKAGAQEMVMEADKLLATLSPPRHRPS